MVVSKFVASACGGTVVRLLGEGKSEGGGRVGSAVQMWLGFVQTIWVWLKWYEVLVRVVVREV